MHFAHPAKSAIANDDFGDVFAWHAVRNGSGGEEHGVRGILFCLLLVAVVNLHFTKFPGCQLSAFSTFIVYRARADDNCVIVSLCH